MQASQEYKRALCKVMGHLPGGVEEIWYGVCCEHRQYTCQRCHDKYETEHVLPVFPELHSEEDEAVEDWLAQRRRKIDREMQANPI